MNLTSYILEYSEFCSSSFNTFMTFMCWFVCAQVCCDVPVPVNSRESELFPLCTGPEWTQVIRLGGKYLALLSHLTGCKVLKKASSSSDAYPFPQTPCLALTSRILLCSMYFCLLVVWLGGTVHSLSPGEGKDVLFSVHAMWNLLWVTPCRYNLVSVYTIGILWV